MVGAFKVALNKGTGPREENREGGKIVSIDGRTFKSRSALFSEENGNRLFRSFVA